MSTIGKETFGLTKTDYGKKLGKIIGNFRAGSRIIGEPREFILRSCRLTEQWGKMANDPDVVVYVRNWDIAAGRKVKMVVLERGGSKQPVPKAKLLDALYPPRKKSENFSTETRHYHMVKAAMRSGITYQLQEYRDSVELPITCSLSGRKIRPGVKTDVDHVGKTFSEICDCFLRERGMCYTDIALIGPPTAKKFQDSTLWKEWQEFHECNARYALTLASANRSKGSDGYVTPAEIVGSFVATNPEDLSLDF